VSSRTAGTILLTKLGLEFMIAVSVFLPELLAAQFATRLRRYLAADADVPHLRRMRSAFLYCGQNPTTTREIPGCSCGGERIRSSGPTVPR
jgi:hypothetical protein